MTRNQLSAIRILRDGVVRFEGRWTWPVDIRANPEMADRFVAWYYQPAKVA